MTVPESGVGFVKTSVLDACALIAFLQDEAGAEVVEDVLTDPFRVCAVHAFNLCEVYYHFWRQGGQAASEIAEAEIIQAGVVIRDDLDKLFWKEIARHKAMQRLSLADCVCLALAERLSAELLTSDHHEFDPIVQLGLCPVLFIR